LGKIITVGSSNEKIKEDIRELCDRNVQFCSRTFSEDYLKTEVKYEQNEIEGMKREAVYGPYSDIAVAYDFNQADSYISLGYEPIYSKNSIFSGMIVLGCRRCSRSNAIRYVTLTDFHKTISDMKLFQKEYDEKPKLNKGECKNEGLPVCHKIFNDSKCLTSKLKSIRIDYRFTNGVLGFERVKFSEFTPVLSHLMFSDSKVSSNLSVIPKYAIWVKAKKNYYDCETISSLDDDKGSLKTELSKKFCRKCTKYLYTAPIIADTCLTITNNPTNLKETIYKINETLLSTNEYNFKYIEKKNIEILAEAKDKRCNYRGYADTEFHQKINDYHFPITVKNIYSFIFEEVNLVKNQHNWILNKYVENDTNPILFSIANTTAKKITIKCEENYPADRDSELPCGEFNYYLLSFKPFDNQNKKDSISQSAITIEDINNLKESSNDVCKKICESSVQDVCQYSSTSVNTKPMNNSQKVNYVKLPNTETKSFDIKYENDEFSPIYVSKNQIKGECINIDYSVENYKVIITGICGEDSIRKEFVEKGKVGNNEKQIIIRIEKDKKIEKIMREDYLKKGYIEWIHPKPYMEKNESFKYWFRIYVKYNKTKGILPFNDYFYNTFSNGKKCSQKLLKEEYSKFLWPEAFINEEKNEKLNGKYLYGNGLTKIKLTSKENKVNELTNINVLSFLSDYKCSEYNLFIPKRFSSDNENLKKLKEIDNEKKIYMRLVKNDDHYEERWSHSGPGMRSIYWVQISNNEKIFNNPKFDEIAWEHGYVSLEPIVYEEIKDSKILTEKTWMRVWVSYYFKLREDKEKLCRLCLENSNRKKKKFDSIIS